MSEVLLLIKNALRNSDDTAQHLFHRSRVVGATGFFQNYNAAR